MLKKLADSVFSFDVEWIPDPKSAEILHDLPPAPGPGKRRPILLKPSGPVPGRKGMLQILNRI